LKLFKLQLDAQTFYQYAVLALRVQSTFFCANKKMLNAKKLLSSLVVTAPLLDDPAVAGVAAYTATFSRRHRYASTATSSAVKFKLPLPTRYSLTLFQCCVLTLTKYH